MSAPQTATVSKSELLPVADWWLNITTPQPSEQGVLGPPEPQRVRSRQEPIACSSHKNIVIFHMCQNRNEFGELSETSTPFRPDIVGLLVRMSFQECHFAVPQTRRRRKQTSPLGWGRGVGW